MVDFDLAHSWLIRDLFFGGITQTTLMTEIHDSRLFMIGQRASEAQLRGSFTVATTRLVT